ncbi:PQQ-binding-like beta-propeller repeat protein [Streptomyces sp. NPDC094448]|uniref:outer membrane protein assembly factor BamB family protein n=1 Tax=Streptomyces sp. NPDC094448 TaxID=3366063 RepID=UPI00381B92CC
MSQPPGRPLPEDAGFPQDPRSGYGYPEQGPHWDQDQDRDRDRDQAQDPGPYPDGGPVPAAGSGGPPYIPPPPPGPPPVPPAQDGQFPAYGTGTGTGPAQGGSFPAYGTGPGAGDGASPGPFQQPGSAQPYPGAQQFAPYTGGAQPGPYTGGTQPGPYGGLPQHDGQAFAYGTVPPAPPGGPGKRRTPILIAAGVAALLVAGAGTYAVVGDDGNEGRKTGAGEHTAPAPTDSAPDDDDDGGGTAAGGRGGETDRDPSGDDLNAGRAPGEARALFVTRNDVDLPRGGAEVHGPWSHGGTIAKAMYRQVVGYSATDGTKKWTVPLERELCSATPRPSAGGAIVVGIKDRTGSGARCRDLRSIDLGTGKVIWKAEIPEEKGFLGLSDHTLTISGNTLAAGATGVSYGFSMKDGKRLFTGPRSGCKPFAYAGGARLLAAVSCPTGDYKKPRHQLQQIDPATGKARWTFDAPAGWEIDKVYSADPVVVSLVKREPKSWTVVALKPDGTLRAPIAGGKERFRVGCGGSFVIFGQNLEGCQGVVADPDTLYLATEPVRGAGGGGNQIVAFDLNTGRPTWRAPSGGDTAAVPVRMDGRNLIVYREPSYGSGGAVASIAPAGGPPKTLLRHPRSAARTENSFYSVNVLYEAGSVYLAARRVSAANDAEELKTPTMLAFGP